MYKGVITRHRLKMMQWRVYAGERSTFPVPVSWSSRIVAQQTFGSRYTRQLARVTCAVAPFRILDDFVYRLVGILSKVNRGHVVLFLCGYEAQTLSYFFSMLLVTYFHFSYVYFHKYVTSFF